MRYFLEVRELGLGNSAGIGFRDSGLGILRCSGFLVEGSRFCILLVQSLSGFCECDGL